MADKWVQLQSEDGLDNLFPTSKMDLLWTNASPSADFSEQTIQLDLSNYTKLLIEISISKTESLRCATIVQVGMAASQGTVCGPSADGSVISREITSITSSSISFGKGAYVNGSTVARTNKSGIPIKIYGIK